MSATGRRVRRGARVVLGLVVAGSFLGPARTGDAQTEPPAVLGGFQGTAAASGLHAIYNVGDLLPIASPVDLGSPDALATIASGPSTFARASVLDPGDLLANPDAFLALASADYPGGIPEYPYRVSAASGTGSPAAESNPGPGLNARVTATAEGSFARATMPVLDAPAVATVASQSAMATTDTDGSTVTVTARSQVSGFDLLGLVKIDALVTDLKATSDGVKTELTGGTRVLGATVAGTPVTIDADGIHQAPGTPPVLGGILGPLTGSLNDVLGQLGIRVALVGPVELAGGRAGQLASTGVRIELELSPQTFPQLAALIDALPPLENPIPGAPSIEDLLAIARGRHLTSIELGRGLVALDARGAATFEPTAPSPVGDLPSFGTDLPSFVPSTPVTPPLGNEAPVLTSDDPALPDASGVAALVLLALLALPIVGEAVARLSLAVLATDRSSSCPWEER